MGGIKKWKSVKTLKMHGIMKMNGMEFPFKMIKKRPNKLFISYEVQDMQGMQVYDGKVGWMVMPFMGIPEPEVMPLEQLKEFIKQADIGGPLINSKEKGYSIELVGETTIENSPVIELKMIESDGQISSIFIDIDTMLEIKTQKKVNQMDTTWDVITNIGDYKAIEGFMVPHSTASSIPGSTSQQIIEILSLEINPEIDNSIFIMPVNQVSELIK